MGESEFDYIRKRYNVPADNGVTVRFEGRIGVITGISGPYILVRMDGEEEGQPHHPTWHMEYLASNSESNAGALDPGIEMDRPED